MTGPSYRKRLIMLEDILADGVKLFGRLRQSEERMRQHLISGDYEALVELERERDLVQKNIEYLEERRKQLVPGQVSMQRYIKTMVGKSRQEKMLGQLKEIKEILRDIRVVHEVNRALLAERTRFSRELRERLQARKAIYDQRGRLSKGEDDLPQNLDRNC